MGFKGSEAKASFKGRGPREVGEMAVENLTSASPGWSCGMLGGLRSKDDGVGTSSEMQGVRMGSPV